LFWEGNVGIFQAKTFWVLTFYNYKLPELPKLQANAEKSFAFIFQTKPVFFQGK